MLNHSSGSSYTKALPQAIAQTTDLHHDILSQMWYFPGWWRSGHTSSSISCHPLLRKTLWYLLGAIWLRHLCSLNVLQLPAKPREGIKAAFRTRRFPDPYTASFAVALEPRGILPGLGTDGWTNYTNFQRHIVLVHVQKKQKAYSKGGEHQEPRMYSSCSRATSLPSVQQPF